jgi:hypothetical protein
VGLNQAVEIYSEEHFAERSKRIEPESWERIRARASQVLGQGSIPTAGGEVQA